MPVKRRTARRSVDPSIFLHGDGWSWSLLTGDRQDWREAEARSRWEECRAETWRLWAEVVAARVGPYPRSPGGARSFDGITDAASVQRFREERPVAARTIADELDLYLVQLEAAAKWKPEQAVPELLDSDAQVPEPDEGDEDEEPHGW